MVYLVGGVHLSIVTSDARQGLRFRTLSSTHPSITMSVLLLYQMTDLRTWVRYTKRCAPSALAKTSLSFSGPHLRTAAVAPGPDELIGNVHFGFCDYYQTLVAKGLADRIALLAKEFPGYNVFITGHSLGAAAAAVCAADMAQRMMIERERLVLYTLGEPRTGDGIFAEGMNDRVVSLKTRL